MDLKMKMSGMVPFMAMIVQQLAQVGLAVAAKVAMSSGMTSFTFTFYSCFLSTLLLIPLSFFLHRSALPPLWPTFLYGFFLLGLLGFLMHVLGLLGLQYSSPLLSTAILQLIPGFTFVLAVILRMETFEYKSLSTVAKTIGSLVSIIGALVATLYKGPQIFGISPLNSILTTPSAWAIGGLLTIISSLIASLFIISQGFFGNVFQVSIGAWCVRKRGPLFVVMFHPIGIVIAMAASMFMGESIHVGSLVGSIIIVVGFYSVIWGKAKEWKKEEKSLGSNNNNMPLLEDTSDNPEVDL